MCVDIWLQAETPAQAEAAQSTAILIRPHIILWPDGSATYRVDDFDLRGGRSHLPGGGYRPGRFGHRALGAGSRGSASGRFAGVALSGCTAVARLLLRRCPMMARPDPKSGHGAGCAALYGDSPAGDVVGSPNPARRRTGPHREPAL